MRLSSLYPPSEGSHLSGIATGVANFLFFWTKILLFKFSTTIEYLFSSKNSEYDNKLAHLLS